MSWWRTVLEWRPWSPRQRRDEEIERELRSHLELEAEEHLDAGLPAGEARYAAQRTFGNTTLIKEDVRAMWGWSSLERLAEDVRYAFRNMRLRPGFALTAMLVLGIGIGANTSIFTVVHAVLLKPPPYHEPHRLVRLYERNVASESIFNVVSPANFLDWQRDAASYEQVAAWGERSFNVSGDGGALPERASGIICTYNVFDTLGIQPALGRSFLPEDDRPDAQRVAILSNGFWQRRFGSNMAILGASIRIDGETYKVIGIMPEGFDFHSEEWRGEIWLPMWRLLPAAMVQDRENHQLSVLARLKPGVTVESAQTELDSIAKRIKVQNPNVITGAGATVALLHERMVFRVRTLLLIIFGAAACVLMIACVNLTNLLLARGVARRRDIAIRMALGAGRGRVLRQLLTESLLLTACGSAVGLILAGWGTPLLVAMTTDLPRTEAIRVNAPVLMFAALAAVLSGLLVGLAPALWSTDLHLASTIHEGGRSASGSRKRRMFRDGLVAIEVALTVVLLIASGLLLKSFLRLHAVDPGFSPERLLTMRLALPQSRYSTAAQRVAFFEGLAASVKALPGVAAVGAVNRLPLTGHAPDNTFTIEGRPPLPPGQFFDALARSVDPGYFQAMGIPLKRGRFLHPSERLEAANKALISESFAETFFRDENPLGKYINLGGRRRYDIVGVVGDVRKSLTNRPEPTMYFSLLEGRVSYAAIVVRTSLNPNLLALPVQKEVARLDSDLPVSNIAAMERILAGGAASRRLSLVLIGIFAGIALLLASVGLYGVVAYSTQQRTNEIGVRIALGAGRGHVLRTVLAQGLRPVAVGLMAGVAIALAMTRVMRSLLFEVSPLDPQVFAFVAVVLAAVALAACAIPARRASRVDPVTALRYE
ncbi:MAG: ABC transporter permease [Acidobacteria bacterium]|nr:ABC transporter permease [Acidobacteriota bacterium]